jgi:hypothetical protein
MIEIFTQLRDTCPLCNGSFGLFYLPKSDRDREQSKEYKLFQTVRNKVYGVRKQRSLAQLDLYFASCQFVADNTDHKQWNTKEKVDFQCRVAAHFVDPDLVVVKPDGTVLYSYRSIAFASLKHIEACHYFDQAFGAMTDFLNKVAWKHIEKKITVDELISKVKESMVGGY